jgi:hypothetical protein
MWNRGELPKDTLYWHDSMSKWAVISDLFVNAPTAPPLLGIRAAKPEPSM